MKLIVCDPVDPEAVAAMRDAGIDVDVHDDVTPEELEEIIPEYDAMVIRSRTKVRKPLIDKATNLKAVIRAGVGLDNIDVEYAEEHGVEVRNTPAASSNSVAELTIAYLFALARPVVQATISMKDGKWEKKAMQGTSSIAVQKSTSTSPRRSTSTNCWSAPTTSRSTFHTHLQPTTSSVRRSSPR